LSLGATLGLIGLVVDIGWAHWRKEACRSAAHSAALAAAIAAKDFGGCNIAGVRCQAETACPVSPANETNIDAGCRYYKQNGFVNQNRQFVRMAAGMGTPPFNGVVSDYWVSATVSEEIPQLFSWVLGNPLARVSARVSAAVYKPPSGACIYALAPAGTGLSVTGSVTVHSGCGIYVNSSDPTSAMTGGGSAVLTASTIKIVGGFNNNGGASVTPAPTTGATATFDPLARVPQPAVPNRCDSFGLSENSVIMMPADRIYVVCGGFNINSNRRVTIPAGTYVMKEGAIDWKNGNIASTGEVTFYLTGTFSAISINGNMSTDLSAPTSGALQGMLFFQDRSHSINTVNFNGGSAMHMNGTLYFPTSAVSYSGGSSTLANYVGIVASAVSFPGTTYLEGDGTGFYTGIGLPSVGLVE